MLKRWAWYRVLRVAFAVAWILPQYLWLQLREKLPWGRPGGDAWDRVHRRTARTMRRLGEHLAGFFVKVCQIIGARSDVFPSPFIEVLRCFHDSVPARPLSELTAHVERELGAPLDSIFEHVEPEPVAAASLAQVHRATLHDGRVVALKIQYPEIARLARVDLASLRRVARIVALVQRRLDLRSIIEEIAKFVALELDFGREATSTKRVGRDFEGSTEVRIPEVVLSSSKVLVLEFLDGVQVTKLEELAAKGHDLKAVAERIARIYCSMIFDRGYFHGDPHPGNILVLSDGAIGLLDFGLAKELPEGFSEGVAVMLASTLTGDAEAATRAARKLGFGVDHVDPEALRSMIRMLVGEKLDGVDVLDLLGNNPVVDIPSDFGLIVRTLILLNGLSHTLAPGERLIQKEMTRALMPHAMRAMQPAA